MVSQGSGADGADRRAAPGPGGRGRRAGGCRDGNAPGGGVEFAARGFDGAKVDRIAARARVNKAMLYYHFKNKAALYREILGEQFRRARRGPARGPSGRRGTPQDQLRLLRPRHRRRNPPPALISPPSGCVRWPRAAGICDGDHGRRCATVVAVLAEHPPRAARRAASSATRIRLSCRWASSRRCCCLPRPRPCARSSAAARCRQGRRSTYRQPW